MLSKIDYIIKKFFVPTSIIISLGLIGYFIFTENGNWKDFGELAANLLIITLLIGPIYKIYNKYLKTKLFHINPQLEMLTTSTLQILMKYRRQLGILTFLIASIHGISYLGIELKNGKLGNENMPLYVIFGIISFIFLLIGALTSNDFSIKKLGYKKWKIIQTIAGYGALLFLILHLNFIEFGEGIGYLIIFIFLLIYKYLDIQHKI